MPRNPKENLSSIIHLIENLDIEEKLYILMLSGAAIRSLFTFHNHDSRVYYVWLEFLLETGKMAYYDHPPLFFLVSGALKTFFGWLQGLGSVAYWLLLTVPLAAIHIGTRDRSDILKLLLAYLVLYTGFTGFYGSGYEVATVASFLSGVAFIYISYKLGSIRDRGTGLYAAAFTAFGWWPAVYSGVLLIDMFASVLIACSLYLHYRLFDNETPAIGLSISTAVVTSAALYAKYYSLVILPVVLLYGSIAVRDRKLLVKKLVPAAAAGLSFLPWLVLLDFNMLDHYAVTHFSFVNYPSPLAFGSFLWQALTPLLLALSLYGLYLLYRSDKKFCIFLALPPALTLGFHFTQVFLLGNSHSLINLTNYMLYTFPMLAAAAARGWRETAGKYRYSELALLLVVATLAASLFSTGIVLEYDSSYTTPNGNLNTLEKEDLERFRDDYPRLHYSYRFDKDISTQDDSSFRMSHFRWISPTKIKIVSLEPVTYRLRLEPLEPVNFTLIKNDKRVRNISLERGRTLVLQAGRGTTVYRFLSDRRIPFVALREG